MKHLDGDLGHGDGNGGGTASANALCKDNSTVGVGARAPRSRARQGFAVPAPTSRMKRAATSNSGCLPKLSSSKIWKSSRGLEKLAVIAGRRLRSWNSAGPRAPPHALCHRQPPALHQPHFLQLSSSSPSQPQARPYTSLSSPSFICPRLSSRGPIASIASRAAPPRASSGCSASSSLSWWCLSVSPFSSPAGPSPPLLLVTSARHGELPGEDKSLQSCRYGLSTLGPEQIQIYAIPSYLSGTAICIPVTLARFTLK